MLLCNLGYLALEDLTEENINEIKDDTTEILRNAGVVGPINITNFRDGSILYDVGYNQNESEQASAEEVVDSLQSQTAPDDEGEAAQLEDMFLKVLPNLSLSPHRSHLRR